MAQEKKVDTADHGLESLRLSPDLSFAKFSLQLFFHTDQKTQLQLLILISLLTQAPVPQRGGQERTDVRATLSIAIRFN